MATTWNDREVKLADGGFISCWVTGLPENCDRANIGVYLGETRLRVEYVGEPDPQACARLMPPCRRIPARASSHAAWSAPG